MKSPFRWLSRWEWLLLAVVLAFHALSYFSALERQSYLADDSLQYLTLAENLRTQGVFSQSFIPPYVPDLQRTPGYPVFLWKVHSPWLVLLLQHLMVLGIGLFLYRLCRQWFSEKSARIATWIWLLQPYPILLSSFFLSEVPFLFFFVSGLSLWLEGMHRQRGIFSLVGFGLLAVSAYVRPLTLVILPIWWGYGWVRGAKVRGALRSPLAGVAMAGMALAILLPWYQRNHAISGKWQFSSMGNLAMLYGRAAGVVATQQGLEPTDDQLFRIGDSLLVADRKWSQVKTYPLGYQAQETEQLEGPITGITLGQMKEQPGSAIKMAFHSAFSMLRGVGFGWAKENLGEWMAWPSAALQLVANLGMYLAFLWGLWRIRKWNSAEWVAFLGIVLIFVASMAIWADGRYRVPADVLGMVFVAAGLDRMFGTRAAQTQD
jgi:4-amino-4-deoxy-L-arabinose transferase-like glycosyltransferase